MEIHGKLLCMEPLVLGFILSLFSPCPSTAYLRWILFTYTLPQHCFKFSLEQQLPNSRLQTGSLQAAFGLHTFSLVMQCMILSEMSSKWRDFIRIQIHSSFCKPEGTEDWTLCSHDYGSSNRGQAAWFMDRGAVQVLFIPQPLMSQSWPGIRACDFCLSLASLGLPLSISTLLSTLIQHDLL